jgi:membrane protease YdiL (CAAX protease family)
MLLAGHKLYGDRLPGLFVFPVSTVLLLIASGWLRVKTGSVWAPSLGHAAANVVGSSMVALLFFGVFGDRTGSCSATWSFRPGCPSNFCACGSRPPDNW